MLIYWAIRTSGKAALFCLSCNKQCFPFDYSKSSITLKAIRSGQRLSYGCQQFEFGRCLSYNRIVLLLNQVPVQKASTKSNLNWSSLQEYKSQDVSNEMTDSIQKFLLTEVHSRGHLYLTKPFLIPFGLVTRFVTRKLDIIRLNKLQQVPSHLYLESLWWWMSC